MRIAHYGLLTALLLPSTSALAAVCAGPSTLLGVDVSAYDGTIDWNQVAASGVAFAFTRVSDGLSADTNFATNYAGIRQAGLARGAYQFFEPTQDPVAQADLLLQKINAPLEQGDLPPVLDLEVTGGLSSAALAASIATWVTTIQNQISRAPIIYTSAGFWNASVASSGFGGNLLWVANYGVLCPTLPSGWSNWTFWQYSDLGSVTGISGSVDLDQFNGSAADLLVLVTNERIFADNFETY